MPRITPPPNLNPRIPRVKLPPNSVDAHVHMFGPVDKYAFAPDANYTSEDATAEMYFTIQDTLGLAKVVLVSGGGRDQFPGIQETVFDARHGARLGKDLGTDADHDRGASLSERHADRKEPDGEEIQLERPAAPAAEVEPARRQEHERGEADGDPDRKAGHPSMVGGRLPH